MAIEQTQYNAIGDKYNTVKTLPFSVFERANLRNTMQPYLDKTPNAAVLDLACGTGFLTPWLVDWGASNVLGIDISSGMIEAANKNRRPADEKRIKFAVGDARSLKTVDLAGSELAEGGGQFDIVLGSWLLNYAESSDEMVKMWTSIAANLKEGGVFVGIVPQTADDLDALVLKRKNFNTANPQYFKVTWEHPEPLANGQGHLGRMTEHGVYNFHFDWYHLRKDIHEKTAEIAGLKGGVEWVKLEMPDAVRPQASTEYWEKYYQFGPHFSILTCEK